MTVKEVICDTLRLVGKDEMAGLIEEDSDLDEESARIYRALLTYLNAVRDELARAYFPLFTEEEMHSDNGQFAFAAFKKTPFSIKSVTSGKKAVKWHISPDYLVADGRDITVKYTYVPKPLGEGEEFSYPDFAVGARLVQYGMIAEYYLVLGDASGSAAWEEKYRNEIETLLSHSTVKDIIPPRRWI